MDLPKKPLTPEFERVVKDGREDRQSKKEIKRQIKSARKLKFEDKG